MTAKALNFLGATALLCVVALVVLAAFDTDQTITSNAETTVATVLVMAVTGIAALVAPAAVRRD